MQWSVSKAVIEERIGIWVSSSSSEIPLVAAQKFAYPSFTHSKALDKRIMIVYCASFVVLFWGRNLSHRKTGSRRNNDASRRKRKRWCAVSMDDGPHAWT